MENKIKTIMIALFLSLIVVFTGCSDIDYDSPENRDYDEDYNNGNENYGDDSSEYSEYASDDNLYQDNLESEANIKEKTSSSDYLSFEDLKSVVNDNFDFGMCNDYRFDFKENTGEFSTMAGEEVITKWTSVTVMCDVGFDFSVIDICVEDLGTSQYVDLSKCAGYIHYGDKAEVVVDGNQNFKTYSSENMQEYNLITGDGRFIVNVKALTIMESYDDLDKTQDVAITKEELLSYVQSLNYDKLN